MNLSKDRSHSVRRTVFLLAAVVAGVLAALLWRHSQETPQASVRQGDIVTSRQSNQTAAGSAAGRAGSPVSNALAPVTSPQSIASSTPPIPGPATDGKDTNS